MVSSITVKAAKVLKRLPNLLHGYNLHVNPEKLRLVERVFTSVVPDAETFADLGGVWRVNAAYSLHALRHFPRLHGTLVDTDIPSSVESHLLRFPRLRLVKGDFGRAEIAKTVGTVDAIFFFDVLLHQAGPDWNEVLALYAQTTRCIVVYNQQLIGEGASIRLTHLPVEEYMAIAGAYRPEFYRYVYEHRNEIHPRYNKPWGDLHNLTQWGITDEDLRTVLDNLGFNEVFFKNHGSFVGLNSLENHSFIFLKK